MARPGEAGYEFMAEWELAQPGLLSYELGDPGLLAVSYTTGVDTRWDPVRLGPLITTLTLSTYDGGNPPANANSAALSGPMNATEFLYVGRGTPVAKVKVSDLSLVNPGTLINLAEAATDVRLIKNAAGTYELVIGMNNTAFRCITAVANAGVADTHAANTPGRIAAILRMAAPSDTLALLGRSGAAGTAENTVWQMALTGSVVPSTGTSTAKNTIPGSNLTFTGFALDGDAWIVGTTDGPYYSDANFDGSFQPLIPEIPLDSFNCKGMHESTFWRIVCPLSQATYALRNVFEAAPIGPETYSFNTSPVRGRMSGFAAGFRWDYANIYNPVSGDTYVCAMRTPRAGDWTSGMGVQANYYPLAKLTATASDFLLNIDKAAGRTNPTIVGGHSSNLFSFILGRHDREHDDTGYTYAASGSLYGTELRRFGHMGKRLVKAQFETAGCTSDETVTLKWSTVDTRGTARTETVRGVVTDNGLHTLRPSPEKPILGWRLAPQLDLARGTTTTNSPQIIGKLRAWFELYNLEER